MKNRSNRPRIEGKIYSFDIKSDEYKEVIPPFKPKKGLVYICAANESETRKKILDKLNQFMVKKGLESKN